MHAARTAGELARSGWSRRATMVATAAVIAAGQTSGFSGSAEAATGWGAGPNAGLPFWLGGHGDLDRLSGLLKPGRSLDLVNAFELSHSWSNVASRAIANWVTKPAHRYLVEGRAAAFQWASSPFCSGSGTPPADWPTGPASITAATWINASRPPTYTGVETTTQRRTKQRRVWQMAADGWLDHIWYAKMRQFKRDYFIRHGLTSIRIVLRAAHEINLVPRWGSRDAMRSYNVRSLNPTEDGPIVKLALARYNDVFLDVFQNKQASISNDHAYDLEQLWPYWCPLKENWSGFDSRVTCPHNARLVGPDLYDSWPASMTASQWRTNSQQRTSQGWPIGIAAWLDWAKSIKRPLAIGEWGVWTRSMTASGTRPDYEGWDNPAYINGFLNFCRANAADIAFVCYFNSDNIDSAALPSHLIGPWNGLADPGMPCARTPPGDLNRCSARAFAQWMARYT